MKAFSVQRLKAQAGRVNLLELYTLLLIAVGLPVMVYAYFGLKLALLVGMVIHIGLGILAMRVGK